MIRSVSFVTVTVSVAVTILQATCVRVDVVNSATRLGTYEDKGRKKFWDTFSKIDDKKMSPLYSMPSTPGDRPTLTTVRYVVLPIWWSDQDPNDRSLKIDVSASRSVMNRANGYYHEMSWNAVDLRFDFLHQQVLSISSQNPSRDETEVEATSLIESYGYVRGVDFDGIMMLHFPAQAGPLSRPDGGWIGWGEVNGDFIWLSYNPSYYPYVNYGIVNHEIGHNMGHDHHNSNKYYLRETAISDQHDRKKWLDGFDLMSGGKPNHFAVASKWFFNWVPDSSIVTMQPEGPTEECAHCLNEGNFTLYAFDQAKHPPSQDKLMGVHIPIIGKRRKIYSYWLSYRSGAIQSKKGLSIHMVWFSLGGPFGGAYDSLNYDAFGDTDTTLDSFVLPGTCYVITPSSYMMDFDYDGSIQVQPIVCVNSLNEGSDISVSVSFLKPDHQQPFELVDFTDIGCSEKGDSASTYMNISSAKNHLLRISGPRTRSVVTVAMCSSHSVKAYFYDAYPYSPLLYGSPHAYGAFRSLSASARDCSFTVPSITYENEYGNTWVLVASGERGTTGTVSLEFMCSNVTTDVHSNHAFNLIREYSSSPSHTPSLQPSLVPSSTSSAFKSGSPPHTLSEGPSSNETLCQADYFFDNGTCSPCPSYTVSPTGSTSILDCKCPHENYFVYNAKCIMCDPLALKQLQLPIRIRNMFHCYPFASCARIVAIVGLVLMNICFFQCFCKCFCKHDQHKLEL